MPLVKSDFGHSQKVDGGETAAATGATHHRGDKKEIQGGDGEEGDARLSGNSKRRCTRRRGTPPTRQ